MSTHTKEQGLRVHHLTNLGGLIALAGLDLEPPDLLLSALFQMPRGSRIVAASDVGALSSLGHQTLDECATGNARGSLTFGGGKPQRFQFCSVFRWASYLNSIKYTFSPDPCLATFNKSTTPRKPERLANSGVISARLIRRIEVTSTNPSPVCSVRQP